MTHEIRVDPLTGLRAIIAPARAGRPQALAAVAPAAPIVRADDPFAAGHEDRTPPAILERGAGGSAAPGGGWAVRVVPNLYPALTPDAADPEPSHRPDLFGAAAATGASEVIVNAPDPVHSLADLDAAQVALAVDVWRERMRAHPDAAYVHVHVNERAEGGATQPHTHAQLLALDFVPALVARERERFGAYATRTMGGDLLSDLLQEEVRQRDRIVAIDSEAVLLAPYASASPYRLMLVPRRGRDRFEAEGPSGAALLHDGLQRLKRRFGSSPPLTLWVRTAPQGATRFCWHIEIAPRLTALAGLELGTGVHLNPVAPELAAAELRDA
ncbi:Galactose-1-phosphate uridylyltransferase [Paraconexibacter sp. AEG42_29]|uniref:Galactose-1-phosphate uridylyltransferase n=1 Tax=Paraconexibacter sp. AEG42_29 TaxID=2997339 RepID=A0AAU7B4B2_9ACTN